MPAAFSSMGRARTGSIPASEADSGSVSWTAPVLPVSPSPAVPRRLSTSSWACRSDPGEYRSPHRAAGCLPNDDPEDLRPGGHAVGRPERIGQEPAHAAERPHPLLLLLL